jgi:hypothetical protein
MTDTKIKERPILFSAEMVRAVLAGRKTQTRRVIKNRPLIEADFSDDFIKNPDNYVAGDCPCGVPGDRLWVRETHAINPKLPASMQTAGTALDRHVRYRADGGEPWNSWRPSIYMPRWASRILLEVTDVRVERVQEISEADAVAEGVAEWSDAMLSSERGLDRWCRRAVANAMREGRDRPGSAGMRDAFSLLWDSVSKPGQQWSDNPWVWAVTFKIVEGNRHD